MSAGAAASPGSGVSAGAGGILAVGSVALDTVETPFGDAEEVVGGAAVYFAAAASLFVPVHIVGVVGEDYPLEALDFLRQRGVDLSGLEQRPGRSFRWSGRYGYDLESRETLSTDLGVFEDFRPAIPAALRESEWLFLGNIDPHLQLDLLDQMDTPAFVACDTMNYWIERERTTLLELLGKTDLLMVNSSEARELSGKPLLTRAARWIQDQGPPHVIIKKGEHGAILFSEDSIFFAPGYPLEDILDPTGAGDAFAGGVLGHLASLGGPRPVRLPDLKRALVYGCAMGSIACEAFGPAGLRAVEIQEVRARVEAFRRMTRFAAEPSLVESGNPTAEASLVESGLEG